MTTGSSVHGRRPGQDETNRPMAELLGGDVMAYRIARRLRREGISDLGTLRREYEVPVWGATVEKGHMLLDIDRLGTVALARIAAALEAEHVGTAHDHASDPGQPDTVVLCGTAPTDRGVRWYHLPVNAHYWHHCTEDERETLRGRVRQEIGDPSTPVEVVEAPATSV